LVDLKKKTNSANEPAENSDGEELGNINSSSEPKKDVLSYLIERFFVPGTVAKKQKDLLHLKTNSIKNFGSETISALEDIGIKTIKDFISADFTAVAEKMMELPIDEKDRDYIVVVGKILKRYLEPIQGKLTPQSKIAVLGMQNAGKTSFINFLAGQSVDDQFKETAPTVSVDNKVVQMNDIQVSIWDFGGQASFRDEYLAHPEEFFDNIEVLVYVVDVQDDLTYADSLSYFDAILSALDAMGTTGVHVIVVFHKLDPDLSFNIDLIIKVQWLEEKFDDILHRFNFSFEFMKSSIFNDLANADEPAVAKNLKEIFLKRMDMPGEVSDEKSMLKTLIFIQTKMYVQMLSLFSELAGGLKNLDIKLAMSQLTPPPPMSSYPSAQQIQARGQEPKHDGFVSLNVVDELKEMFKKKRMNIT
jgi:small GTP-binding protein